MIIEEKKRQCVEEKKPSMARSGKICIELNFIRDEEGRSRRAKIKSFWEFIDAQKELIPLNPSEESIKNSSNRSVCQKSNCEYRHDDQSTNISSQEIDKKDSISDNSKFCAQSDQIPSEKSIWYDELRIFKELGLDRAALAASNVCKRCLRDERNNLDKEPELADSFDQSYDELNADLKAFHERIKHQKPKCVYKDSGKYEHLIQ